MASKLNRKLIRQLNSSWKVFDRHDFNIPPIKSLGNVRNKFSENFSKYFRSPDRKKCRRKFLPQHHVPFYNLPKMSFLFRRFFAFSENEQWAKKWIYSCIKIEFVYASMLWINFIIWVEYRRVLAEMSAEGKKSKNRYVSIIFAVCGIILGMPGM